MKPWDSFFCSSSLENIRLFASFVFITASTFMTSVATTCDTAATDACFPELRNVSRSQMQKINETSFPYWTDDELNVICRLDEQASRKSCGQEVMKHCMGTKRQKEYEARDKMVDYICSTTHIYRKERKCMTDPLVGNRTIECLETFHRDRIAFYHNYRNSSGAGYAEDIIIRLCNAVDELNNCSARGVLDFCGENASMWFYNVQSILHQPLKDDAQCTKQVYKISSAVIYVLIFSFALSAAISVIFFLIACRKWRQLRSRHLANGAGHNDSGGTKYRGTRPIKMSQIPKNHLMPPSSAPLLQDVSKTDLRADCLPLNKDGWTGGTGLTGCDIGGNVLTLPVQKEDGNPRNIQEDGQLNAVTLRIARP